MSFKFIIIITFLELLAPFVLASEGHMIRRMRQVPIGDRPCAMSITWEQGDPKMGDSDWESVIVEQNRILDANLRRAQDSQTVSYRKLVAAQSTARSNRAVLDQIAPLLHQMDSVSRSRWQFLEDKLKARIGVVDLQTIHRVGADAEFSMVYFDSEFKLLRLNTKLSLDPWVYSKSSTDVEDVDVVTAGQLAGAVFQVHTTQSPDHVLYNRDFLEFCLEIERTHPELETAFASKIRPVEFLPWRNDLVGQIWLYLKERLVLEESLRVYRALHTAGYPAYSFQLERLAKRPLEHQEAFISGRIREKHQLQRELIRSLGGTSAPIQWTR